MTLNFSRDIVFESCFDDLDDRFLNRFYKDITPFSIKLSGFDGEKPVSTGYLFEISVNDLKGYYLYGLATLPEYRNQGRMTSLLNEAEKIAAKNGKDFLYLATNNCKAEKLYNDFGFKKVVFPYNLIKSDKFSDKFISSDLTEYLKKTKPEIYCCEKLRLSMLESISGDISVLKNDEGFALVENSDGTVLDFYPKNGEYLNVLYNSLNYPSIFFNSYTFMFKSLTKKENFSEFSYILH